MKLTVLETRAIRSDSSLIGVKGDSKSNKIEVYYPKVINGVDVSSFSARLEFSSPKWSKPLYTPLAYRGQDIDPAVLIAEYNPVDYSIVSKVGEVRVSLGIVEQVGEGAVPFVWSSYMVSLRVADAINAMYPIPEYVARTYDQLKVLKDESTSAAKESVDAKNITVLAKDEVLKSGAKTLEYAETVALDKDSVEKAAIEVEENRLLVQTAKETVEAAKGVVQTSEQFVKMAEESTKISESNAKDSETHSEQNALEALNNKLNGIEAHDLDEMAHLSLRNSIQRVETIARGRATGLSFPTYADMMAWFAGTYQYPDGRTPADLVVGDNLYDETLGTPDYWWNGTQLRQLGAEAPDMSAYYSKIEIDAMMPIPIARPDYEALEASGGILAGRTYDIYEV